MPHNVHFYTMFLLFYIVSSYLIRYYTHTITRALCHTLYTSLAKDVYIQ